MAYAREPVSLEPVRQWNDLLEAKSRRVSVVLRMLSVVPASTTVRNPC